MTHKCEYCGAPAKKTTAEIRADRALREILVFKDHIRQMANESAIAGIGHVNKLYEMLEVYIKERMEIAKMEK